MGEGIKAQREGGQWHRSTRGRRGAAQEHEEWAGPLAGARRRGSGRQGGAGGGMGRGGPPLQVEVLSPPY